MGNEKSQAAQDAQGAHTQGAVGRRSLLGAAVLSAGAAALASPGVARAADRGSGGNHSGQGVKGLPVPTVIGHRGASGYRPEHTLGSYQLALDMGAHVVEAGDICPTKDGHLVCRHEPEIGGTTDVSAHPEFASRKTTKVIDGVSTTGWFTEDFTLAELKTLRAKERIPGNRQRNTLYDGRWEIPTFEEVLAWRAEQSRKRGREVWIYPETKHPTYFRKLGLGLEERLAKILRAHGLHRKNSPVILQSFEPTSIQRLNKLVDNPLAVLLSTADSRPADFVDIGDPRTVADLITPKGLREIARYAQGIGPTLDLIIPKDAAGKLQQPTTLVKDAHAAGLILHPYTMRNENTFLPADFKKGTDPNAYGDAFGAFKAYYETGIDGIFSDNCDTALLARADFVNG
ncbi:glycerophosphodiester phosphodiesterase [Streptomyces sp. SID14478]|uniref:glycerophosphodiester phosphodiesterase n=1 Tax=Streptomyces sp. SID14478 TaxID=2706073 RepID=UPI0013DBCF9F|nr:glycerophosphodiester phosphodiesterase [Streptomyces sp. SID14478]NEB77461.1 glycerophosphodiester phosphodiesterase [Streptomyces sp. SID14478]